MSTSGSREESGTSMASPHVAGIAALYLADNPSASPSEVRDHVLNSSTSGVLSSIGASSPNRLAFVPRQLVSSIDGPTAVYASGEETWYAVVNGGDYTYNYEWWMRIYYSDGTPGAWESVGADEPSVTLLMGMPQPDFELRLRVTSGTQNHTSNLFVTGNCNEVGDCPLSGGDPETVSGGI